MGASPPAQPPESARPASPAPPAERRRRSLRPPLSPPSRERKRKAADRRSAAARRPVKKTPPAPAPYKIEVYIDPRVPEVDAFVLMKGKKQMAVRSWELTDEGIAVVCRCEKWYRCPAHGTVLEPVDGAGIEAQIEAQIEELRQEYGISSRRVFRYAVVPARRARCHAWCCGGSGRGER